MLSILEQNPGTSWEVLLNNTPVEKTMDPATAEEKTSAQKSGDDLVSFKL